jgi:hypothetical protein
MLMELLSIFAEGLFVGAAVMVVGGLLGEIIDQASAGRNRPARRATDRSRLRGRT